MVCSTSFQQFNVYHMYNAQTVSIYEQVMFDCLNYHVPDEATRDPGKINVEKYSSKTFTLPYQIILYCIRPSEKLKYGVLPLPETVNQNFTFNQLRLMNVTCERLYSWSAPIDLAEQYQIYLNGDDSLSATMFHNCTQGWFGFICQYSFRLPEPTLSFASIVKTKFQLKQWYHDRAIKTTHIFTNLSCYTHVKCNRAGLGLACLDWREICDGKVDCSDGGIDEQDCDQLEVNECSDNEYRCHNGQCIPEDVFWDISQNPDCLDGSDETGFLSYSAACAYDPSFRCEDIMYHSRDDAPDIACGDGSYVDGVDSCVNGRDLLLKKAMVESTLDVSVMCRDAMACLSNIDVCDRKTITVKHCPDLFQFPGVPVLFGHVTFHYRNNVSELLYLSRAVILPSYVCYDVSLLPLRASTNISNHSACVPIEKLSPLFINSYFYISWDTLIREIKRIFYASSVTPGGYCHHKNNLYSCKSMVKCISKHRLLDGINDCFLKDDEDFEGSCTLSHGKHRLACKHKCFSPILMQTHQTGCSEHELHQSPYGFNVKKRVAFQTICDGFVELTPIEIDGQIHTDETECHLWACNNTYTRCNGIRNCLNGTDEMGCLTSTCPLLPTKCFSIDQNILVGCKLTSFIETSNSGMNCSDISEKFLLCKEWNPSFASASSMWCENLKICAQAVEVCVNQPKCTEVEGYDQFCSIIISSCRLKYDDFRDAIYKLLCNYNGLPQKSSFIAFHLNHSRVYPTSVQSRKTPAMGQRKHRSLDYMQELKWIWRCNRGVSLYVTHREKNYEQKCLCPPSYYGDLCQYQNQRVSITLQVRALSQWETTFAIILILIDEAEKFVNSYDEIEYQSMRDCDKKFNIYLLYSTRPKNLSKNYSVQIDLYNKQSLTYIASWWYPIQFLFLPVNRIALRITIPTYQTDVSSLRYGTHGQLVKYQNTGIYFHRCHYGWSGSACHKQHACPCANGSLCIAPSICLCPYETFGPRCYLRKRLCKLDSCMNGGMCVLPDERISQGSVVCVCPDGFFGPICQFQQIRIEVKLRQVHIPPFALIHFVEIFDKKTYEPPIQTMTFKRIAIYDDSIIVYRTAPFHIVLIQLDKIYYLSILSEQRILSGIIAADVHPSRRCFPIDELFNTTFVKFHLVRRIKYYHIPCKQYADLACFHDDTHLCLCNLYNHANCFEFNHSTESNCRETNYCENGGRCFSDDRQCPTRSACLCLDCFYGSRCQISSTGNILSLDLILGYHILQNIKFTQQPLIIKMSCTFTTISSYWLDLLMVFSAL